MLAGRILKFKRDMKRGMLVIRSGGQKFCKYGN